MKEEITRDNNKRVIIEEVANGFKVGDDLHETLREAIESVGGSYTFIPGSRV